MANIETAELVKNYRMTTEKLRTTMTKVSTGTKLNRPGDEVADFSRVTSIDFDRSSGTAQAQAAQSRINWFETSVTHLSDIREVLSTMSTLAARAMSGGLNETDMDAVNREFQELKAHISSVVDGQGGTTEPYGSFLEVPGFLGYTPMVSIGAGAEVSAQATLGLNLYTGQGHGGFSTMPLVDRADGSPSEFTLSGVADTGSTSSITLDATASSIPGVYEGMQLEIIAGTGLAQSATIASYDGITRVATFVDPMAVSLDSSSEYQINSGSYNYFASNDGQGTSVRVADHIWGADNDRIDVPDSGVDSFRALTEDERAFRTANAIPDSDLDPHTLAEKTERRQKNIFDEEFGNLLTAKNAQRMFAQVNQAIDRVSILTTRQAAKAGNLAGQVDYYQKLADYQDEGVHLFSDTDMVDAGVSLSELENSHSLIMELAARLSQNFASLNSLVRNRGTL